MTWMPFRLTAVLPLVLLTATVAGCGDVRAGSLPGGDGPAPNSSGAKGPAPSPTPMR
ncbi:hypothetical protein OG909_23050 [Streptomyces sp. NBC_01754]|uniref:hypothetical protein n=1 Tax=Streptomyces sp. NBC_01754 TaxID=2975930 RepID=UPI002DDBD384|nr:hypothetical protein [Streptomyces sp. NBC_01754]WSC94919.1 hypothetical protein OG909_23050 [Streptomyces sp. NBC_01754]